MKTRHLAIGAIAGMAISVQLSAQAPSAAPRAPLAQTAVPAPQAPPAPSGPAGNAVNGRKLFVSFGCYQCHGYEAQGSSATGPRLGPRPIAFAAFSKQIRRPSNEMPPYTAKVASDAELADIYAFLRSLPAPPDAATLTILK